MFYYCITSVLYIVSFPKEIRLDHQSSTESTPESSTSGGGDDPDVPPLTRSDSLFVGLHHQN